MPRDPISEIHSPGKRSWESIGEVTQSCCDRSESPDQYSENDSWEEEDSRGCLDIMKVFIGFSRDDSSEEGSGNRLREEESSLRIVPRDHRPVEGRDDHPTDHSSRDDVEIIFPFLTFVLEWIREFILSKYIPIE